MVTEINTLRDVTAFAKQLVKESINFHCDTDFNDYVNLETNKRTFTKKEADFRNKLMNKCFDVCNKRGVDVYDCMGKYLIKGTFLEKYLKV